MAKPIKTLELHYPMIQFLIIMITIIIIIWFFLFLLYRSSVFSDDDFAFSVFLPQLEDRSIRSQD